MAVLPSSAGSASAALQGDDMAAVLNTKMSTRWPWTFAGFWDAGVSDVRGAQIHCSCKAV